MFDIPAVSCKETLKIKGWSGYMSEGTGSEEREVVFTSGTTQSINLVAFGYAFNNLKEHDEIILNEAEHASNILPWYEIANKLNLKITFAPLNEHGQVDVNKLRELISEKTKLISIAYVSNVLGSVNDVKEISPGYSGRYHR